MENKRRIWQVGELGTLVQRVIDNEPVFGNLWVRGEISNFKKHTAGHLYFSLKDNQASVRAVMFKSRAWSLNFTPTDGMDCLVRGYLSVYPRDTMLQLYVEEIIPAGVGLQHVLLEELKKRLGEKGYFATERKRPLPFLPRAVGVVTSPVGAAIRDIFQVIRRRYPGMPVIVYPALVQGEKAAPRVARGIEVLNDTAEVDVIIVARGGGSTEDLAVFNSEIVAEAFFTSQKPIISAIGHEIDVTIADLVADLRAPTPSAAAELVVPVKRELEKRIEKMREGLSQAVESRLEREKMRLAYLADAGVMKRPDRWLQGYQEGLDRQEKLLVQQVQSLHQAKIHQLGIAAGKLQALSPLATLARGYAICSDDQGRIVRAARQVNIQDTVSVRLAAGSIFCRVMKKEEEISEQGTNL